MSSTTPIEIDGTGGAASLWTRVKVTQIVLDKIAYGWSPEEMHAQHPHLSLAQIQAALTYDYENQAIMTSRSDSDRKMPIGSWLRSDPAFRALVKRPEARVDRPALLKPGAMASNRQVFFALPPFALGHPFDDPCGYATNPIICYLLGC